MKPRHFAIGLIVVLAATAFATEMVKADADHEVAHAARAAIRVPPRVVPGRKVTIKVTGYPSRAGVRVQFGVYYNPVRNCCVTNVIPSASHRPFALGRDGSRRLRVRMPRHYARCVSSACSSPAWKRWSHGQRIFVAVYTDNFGSGSSGDVYRSARSRVR